MCGISGFIDFNEKSSEHVLHAMTNKLSHRGPDGNGYFYQLINDAQIGLGHRRLSIIDLSEAGKQPMEFDGLHIVFNGEIYNYQEITEELILKGHKFNSHSDTEVILHSIREWGTIHKWKGMFAIVIYDSKKQQLICIRDRAGVKPFYYYWNDDLFIFGSELKSIVAHPNFIQKVSKDAVSSFLQYGYVPHPYSIYENTFKLSPGHILTFDVANKKIHQQQYWNIYDYYNKPKLEISFEDAKVETERILDRCFNYRMVADVPVGVFLSGGFDSSCVSALLQKDSIEKIKTFTIGNTDQQHNEAIYAKEVASVLGTDHTEYYCTSKEALDIIPDLPYYYDEPFGDSSAIPTILVSRLARKKVTVALSADAGDEVFAGYNRYDYILKYYNKISAIPLPLRKLVSALMKKLPSEKIPYFNNTYHFNSRYNRIANLLTQSSSPDMMKSSLETFPFEEVQTLMAQRVHQFKTNHISDELGDEYFDTLSYMQAVDYQTYLTDDILQKVDRATMSISLEGREPFLDQEIIEWAAQLPVSYKYNNGIKKYILKEIVYKYIPKKIMDRPKMGFGIPMDKWLASDLKELVEEYINEQKLQHGLFNTTEVLKIKNAFNSHRKDLHIRLWHILMFQMWYEKWVTNKPF
jgi:asparagine synthase (glutamine-hydrolysing)